MIAREDIIGAWELVSYYVEFENGLRQYPLGEDVTGFLLYTPDGYMSAQLMAAGRPVYESDHPHRPEDREAAWAARGYHAYSGRFVFDPAEQDVMHYMDVSLFPNRIGKSQVRKLKLEGNQLYVSNPLLGNTIIWQRAEDNTDNVIEEET